MLFTNNELSIMENLALNKYLLQTKKEMTGIPLKITCTFWTSNNIAIDLYKSDFKIQLGLNFIRIIFERYFPTAK